ncbi:hypothetical protein NDU88_001179 [Pleurodeles waltl]|uniref:Metalloendopeptidase n=1 Tax=Pleurodeles waltl TaxID=8319 RepID=A0AAV7LWV9_PLEWA|nr:hypothetical protein NDU88_001179 [Pleurodeles waltl]
MHALALTVLALCTTGWAFPAQNPLLKRTQRLQRDLGGVSVTKQSSYTTTLENQKTGAAEQRSTFDIIYEINEKVPPFHGRYFVEDMDIVRVTQRGAGVCSTSICTWAKGPDGNVYVPYTMSSAYGRNELVIFQAVFNEFADSTCIRFVPRTTEKDYISFESASGCWSPIGRVGGQQSVTLSKSGCMVTGVISHELMHSLGFNHEHVREDRDSYVTIQWDNILSGYSPYFVKTYTNNMKFTPYDYGSILHYGKTAFSKDGPSQTITTIPDSSIKIGQTFGMSDSDIRKINLLYQCDAYGGNNPADFQTTASVTTTTATTTSKTTTTTPRTRTSTTTITTPLRTTTTTPRASTTTTTTPRTTPTPTTTTTTTPRTTPTPTTTTTTTPRTTPTPTTTTTVTTRTATTTTKSTTTTPSSTTSTTPKDTQTPVCGGVLTAPSGEITSPDYPNLYPASTYCHWNITATKRVSILFVDFALEESRNCKKDYMQMDGGLQILSYLPNNKYCGVMKSPMMISFGSPVQVVFFSDSNVQSRGFRLKYTSE